MADKYFVIHNSEGETLVDVLSKSELIKRISESYYGSDTYLSELPEERDTDYWGGSILVIKGDIVVPEPIKVVQKWDIK